MIGYPYLPNYQQQFMPTMQNNQVQQQNNNIIYVQGIEGATVGEISLAIAIDGEPIQTSRARYTPAAVDQYGNVTSTAIITVPKGCCFNVSVENTSESATPDTTPAPAINVQNANMVITRIA